MGEVGGGTEGGLHGEVEVSGRGEAVAKPIEFGRVEDGGEIEEKGFRRSEFKVGREAFDEGDDFAAGGDLGVFVGFHHEEVGATGEGAGGAESGEKSVLSGGGVDFEER